MECDAAIIWLSGAVKQKTLLAVVPRPMQAQVSNLFRLSFVSSLFLKERLRFRSGSQIIRYVYRASFALRSLAMCFPISTLHFSVFIKDIVENLFYKNLGKGFEKAAGALRPGSLIMN